MCGSLIHDKHSHEPVLQNQCKCLMHIGLSLTTEDLSIRQRQQRGVQWVLSVSENGISPVHLIYYLRVHAVLLRDTIGKLVYNKESVFSDGMIFVVYLDVSDQLQSGCFYGGLTVDD